LRQFILLINETEHLPRQVRDKNIQETFLLKKRGVSAGGRLDASDTALQHGLRVVSALTGPHYGTIAPILPPPPPPQQQQQQSGGQAAVRVAVGAQQLPEHTTVSKNGPFEPFIYFKTNILPRQAGSGQT
jgi:hypothetical protein